MEVGTVSSTITAISAFAFALDPNPAQQRALLSHCGAQRFAFNWVVGAVRANLAQREAERSYGIADQDLTPALGWNAYALRKRWNGVKHEVAPWWAENSKEAYSNGIANAAAALGNWYASKTGKRAGKKVGFPRFHGRRHRASCRFTTGVIRVEADRRHVTLPRLGTIRIHENARKLARHLERGTGRIVDATISYRRGRWQVSLTCELTRAIRPVNQPRAAVGIDLGIKTLAVVSTGEVIANPKHLETAERKLRLASRTVSRRQGPEPRAGRQPSKRWLRANAKRSKVHYRVANLRENAMHHLTRRLSTEFGTVVIEDLNIAGMAKSKRLAKKIYDASWGMFARQMRYKTGWAGSELIVADRFLPSSKTCSACGVVKAKLPLAFRVFRCEHCASVVDRDLNAALNLAKLAQAYSGTGSGSGTSAENGGNGRGDHERRAPMPEVVDEPSTSLEGDLREDRPPAMAGSTADSDR